ncbi:hypothetical protein VUR80DRAFT_8495 [Thermomyces stellatus]
MHVTPRHLGAWNARKRRGRYLVPVSFFQSPGWCAMCVDVLGCSVKAVWPIVFEHALAGATGSVHTMRALQESQEAVPSRCHGRELAHEVDLALRRQSRSGVTQRKAGPLMPRVRSSGASSGGVEDSAR